MINQIGFPSLGILFSLSPIAFHAFGRPIYFYGIIIAIAIITASTIALKRAHKRGIHGDLIVDAIIWCVIGGIIGARLYYVIFSGIYDKFWEIFAIWQGGLAIYGGIIGGIIALILFCKIKVDPEGNLKHLFIHHDHIPADKVTKKAMFLHILDVTAPALLIAQSIGRWGNFFNAEAHGTTYSGAFSMTINARPVHPTFLYESIWCLLGALFIIFLAPKIAKSISKSPIDGFEVATYCIWYGIGRVFIEGIRADSLMLGPLRISQLVSLALILLGAIYIILQRRKP